SARGAASDCAAAAAAPAPPAPAARRKRRREIFVEGACVGTDACAVRCDDVLMRTSGKDTARDVRYIFGRFSICRQMLSYTLTRSFSSFDGQRVTFDGQEQTTQLCYSTVVIGNLHLRY